MTYTWATFLAELRQSLQDTGGTPRWSDAYLCVETKNALRDYSTWFPRRVDRYALVEADSRYPLPADYVEGIAVECPQETYLEPRQETPGRTYYTSNVPPTCFFISGGNLYLNGSPRDEDVVLLTYEAVHPMPVDEDDDTFEFTVPDRDVELLSLYARAQVHSQMRGKQARLDRFEPGAGRRDDNPLLPETNALMQEYQSKIAQRLGGRIIRLYRPGRTR